MPDLRELLADEAARREPGRQPPFEALVRARQRRRARNRGLTAGGVVLLGVAPVLALPALFASPDVQELIVAGPSTSPTTSALPRGDLATASAHPTPKDGSPTVTCRTEDLRAKFVSGGLDTKNDFGLIVAWNIAKHRCRLSGAAQFAAYYANGSPDQNAGASGNAGPVDVLLQPRMNAYVDFSDDSTDLSAVLQGAERDDPSQPNGQCREQDKLTPAILNLRIGGISLRVPNHDPNGDNKAIYGCYGQVQLNSIQGPNPTPP